MAAVFFFVRLRRRKHDPRVNVRVPVRAEGLNGCGTAAALGAVGGVEVLCYVARAVETRCHGVQLQARKL